MIQEIKNEFKNQYEPLTPLPGDAVLCMRDDRLLAAARDGEIRFPTAAETGRAGAYLFSIGETRYFAGDAAPFGDYAYRDGAFLRAAAPREAAFAAVTGLHLLRWYADNRFCGRCGAKTRPSDAERALVCDCGNVIYPKICPAVIVGVVSRGRICLTKYNRPAARWALVAGYTEIGETLEETVRREVMEETGLRAVNIRYYRSQPWGLTGSLLAGYYCEVEGDDTIRVDNVELKEGRWFSPEEIDFPDDGISMTRKMIEAFRLGNAP